MSPLTTRGDVPWDRPLIVAVALLCLMSLLALRSAAETLNPALVGRQALWVGLGVVGGLLVASRPYTRWLDLSVFLYGGAMVLLLVVGVAGTVKLGAARWITIFGFSVQPSELAKIACACALARYMANRVLPVPLRAVIISACLAGLPALLIFMQPDLGSSSIVVAMWIGTVWAAGLATRHLVVLTVTALSLFPLGWHLLKEYQQSRLLAFINPHADPLGAGYTIIQSQIAIGSGQFVGRGWLAGTQNQLNFLPERHADFLFSVIGEEWGFLGAATVVGLFGLVIWRAIRIALQNSDQQGRLLAIALASWIAYQTVVNMGMVMGLLPVVGVPLPFVSYGGSAMVAAWIAIGLLQSLHRFGTRF